MIFRVEKNLNCGEGSFFGHIYYSQPDQREIKAALHRISELCRARAGELYGESEIVEKRLTSELRFLDETGSAFHFAVLKEIAELSKEEQSLMLCAGNGPLLIEYLLGASPIDPLPPHYRCDACRTVEFSAAAGDGYDLTEKNCPCCGKRLHRDGHTCADALQQFDHQGRRKWPYIGVKLSAAVIGKLSDLLLEELQKNSQEKLFFEIELPLARVLASMEHTGFAVDRAGIAAYGEKLKGEITALQEEIWSLSGCEFNINSPKQLGETLFEKLRLPHGKKTKSGYSTNAEVLEGLRYEHPVVDAILRYRALAKLNSTYCEGLLKVVSPDGRIHSNFNQTETRTGRISSTEPNLQNIPVRTAQGRELRRFFVAKEGCVLVDADYSQIELRVLAHVADDENMIESFRSGVDIHRTTAAQVFSMPEELVTSEMRSRAKAVNFGIVYGIGAFSLSKDIGVSRKEAERYIENYLNHFPGVRDYLEHSVALARERGYAETIFGRRRYLQELSSSNFNLRSFGERVAKNMPIQGAAADIIKIAMIRVFERLRRENLRAKLILQVHDELIVEAPQEEAEQAANILTEEMENAVSLRVPMIADSSIGNTWYDAKG